MTEALEVGRADSLTVVRALLLKEAFHGVGERGVGTALHVEVLALTRDAGVLEGTRRCEGLRVGQCIGGQGGIPAKSCCANLSTSGIVRIESVLLITGETARGACASAGRLGGDSVRDGRCRSDGGYNSGSDLASRRNVANRRSSRLGGSGRSCHRGDMTGTEPLPPLEALEVLVAPVEVGQSPGCGGGNEERCGESRESHCGKVCTVRRRFCVEV